MYLEVVPYVLSDVGKTSSVSRSEILSAKSTKENAFVKKRFLTFYGF